VFAQVTGKDVVEILFWDTVYVASEFVLSCSNIL